jgi:gamma-glutamyl hercynylcysteine S-oxide synthase
LTVHKISIVNTLILLLNICSTSCLQAVPVNDHFLLAPAADVNRGEWLKDARQYRDSSRADAEKKVGANTWRIYDREDLRWMSTDFACRMCMTYDTDFYDPSKDEYLIDSILADGVKEFGGYSSIVLWQAYPRLGFDERNQFDFYRDMPGGLARIKTIVERCHSKNVRVFIDYNPWDTGTRREAKGDYEMLAEVIAAIDADGIFLDTLSEGSEKMRSVLDKAKPGIAIVTEGHPPVEQLSICSGSWGQWLDEPGKPGILKLKWTEPRHMQYQIRRWDRDRSNEIKIAFFNGSGMLIWENIFGTHNPWNLPDRQNWKKANLILHYFADIFAGPSSDPYYPSRNSQVYINHWSSSVADLFVLINRGEALSDEILFEIPFESQMKLYDLWQGRVIEPNASKDKIMVSCPLGKIGCVLAVRDKGNDVRLQQFLQLLSELSAEQSATVDLRNFSKPVVYADPVPSTPILKRTETPSGMVFVPGAVKTFGIEHIRGECGCFPDPGKENIDGTSFGYGLKNGAVYDHVIHELIRHKIGPVAVKPFFIDEAEVTNAEYKRFIDSTGYSPKQKQNFLKHWPEGKMPQELADHPVVYVDIDDARAYAKWAGKRLPTEFEWQLAAQGPDNRKWPWGDTFDSNNCNTTGTHTLPVRSCPAGRSPYGCYNMSGNVWEWTESCRDDGHTRFTMIRGGSYFNAEGSIWYVKGGPQPCGYHAKFIRIWPGLDRCSTIGFRCVVDAE